MLKLKEQKLNTLEECLIVKALTMGCKDYDRIASVAREISNADIISFVSLGSLPIDIRYYFSVGKYDYYVGDCEGSETALYIVRA